MEDEDGPLHLWTEGPQVSGTVDPPKLDLSSNLCFRSSSSPTSLSVFPSWTCDRRRDLRFYDSPSPGTHPGRDRKSPFNVGGYLLLSDSESLPFLIRVLVNRSTRGSWGSTNCLSGVPPYRLVPRRLLSPSLSPHVMVPVESCLRDRSGKGLGYLGLLQQYRSKDKPSSSLHHHPSSLPIVRGAGNHEGTSTDRRVQPRRSEETPSVMGNE